ncbi:MAG: site-2 protease family protein [Anaerolineae bacterium]|nr:site-2 protease family protein [Anaerolineae bacterium]
MLLSGNPTLAGLISMGLALLIGMTFHEYMHNYVGWLMGDPTPEREGRLTLNPLVHIYWPGWLMWVAVGFGILGSAPINPALMNYPRVRWANQLTRVQRFGLAVLAGPVGSFIVAVVFAIPFRLLVSAAPEVLTATPNPQIIPNLARFLTDLVFWNVLLAIFNLLPLGMIDGRYILKMFLPPQYHYQYDSFQDQYGNFVLIGLIMLSFVGFNIFGTLLVQPTMTLTQLLGGPEMLLVFVRGF